MFCSPCGGASVGDYDLVQTRARQPKALICRSGRVALRPGQPDDARPCSAACTYSACPAIRCRPVVCAFLFLVPLIRQLSGRADIEPQQSGPAGL